MKVETKYDLGDWVWWIGGAAGRMIHGGQIATFVLAREQQVLHIRVTIIDYGGAHLEYKLYPTAEAAQASLEDRDEEEL